MKKLILLLLVIVAAMQCEAQQSYLTVYKPGKKTKYQYHIGDKIVIQPVRNFPRIRGFITDLSDSAIYFGANDSVHFSNIEAIVINEDPRVFGKNLWLTNLVVSSGSIALWELMYKVNTGEFSPDVKAAPVIIGFVTFTPLVVNGVARLVKKTHCPIGEGDWKLGVVSFP